MKHSLKAIPIGGHGEVGKNCWVLEYEDEIVIINYGMMLPPPGLAGVDLVLPSTTYLKENENKIKGIILTSANDSCCGGMFYLLEKVKIPKIWGSKLAIEIVKSTLPKTITFPEAEELQPRQEFKAGNNFNVKPIRNTSILPDTYGLFIRNPSGNIIYTGPFKIDQTPLDNKKFDYFSYAEAGETGVDLLISNSTNIETPGYSRSEKNITRKFNEIIRDTTSRLIIIGYANNLYKYQIIFNIASKYKKKILLSGDCLINKIETAMKIGVITADKNLFVQKKDLKPINENDLIIIVSGKYGDFLNALIEIAKEEHKEIKLKLNDTVVISANPPPGTVRTIAHTIDQLFVQKVQVIGGKGQEVHVSGHAAQEEAKLMLTITNPKAFVPSHGEERQFVLYELFAETIGISPNDIHILKNGDVLELREGIARVKGRVHAESIYYNQAKNLDIDEVTMKERQTLSEEGTITVALTVDKDKNIIAGPEMLAEGCSFAKGKDWRAFCLGTIEMIREAIKQAKEQENKETIQIKPIVKDIVNKNVLELIGKRPLINVSIQEVTLSA